MRVHKDSEIEAIDISNTMDRSCGSGKALEVIVEANLERFKQRMKRLHPELFTVIEEERVEQTGKPGDLLNARDRLGDSGEATPEQLEQMRRLVAESVKRLSSRPKNRSQVKEA